MYVNINIYIYTYKSYIHNRYTILNANNIGDESDREFVKQDTDFLFKNLPYLRKISNTVTTLGAKVNVITEGAGTKKKPKKSIKKVLKK